MIAVVFPGQGSQRPGMGTSLYEETAAGKMVFDEVSEAIGLDMTDVCFRYSEEDLRRTENAQVALYTCGLAAWFALKDQISVEVDNFAGHSVGEYPAIVAAGVLSVSDGAKLVRRRGEIMTASGATKPGTMAAVLGLERDLLEQVCADVAGQGICVIANDNSPGQIVISGDTNAVQAASALAGERGAKRVVPLNVSGAFHSPLLSESAKLMGEALAAAPFGSVEQKHAVYANVTAAKVEHAREWPDLLEKQLVSPVRWTESIQNMTADGIDTYIECGVGEVLCGLIRRIEPTSRLLKVVDTATLEETASQLRKVTA